MMKISDIRQGMLTRLMVFFPKIPYACEIRKLFDLADDMTSLTTLTWRPNMCSLANLPSRPLWPLANLPRWTIALICDFYLAAFLPIGEFAQSPVVAAGNLAQVDDVIVPNR